MKSLAGSHMTCTLIKRSDHEESWLEPTWEGFDRWGIVLTFSVLKSVPNLSEWLKAPACRWAPAGYHSGRKQHTYSEGWLMSQQTAGLSWVKMGALAWHLREMWTWTAFTLISHHTTWTKLYTLPIYRWLVVCTQHIIQCSLDVRSNDI